MRCRFLLSLFVVCSLVAACGGKGSVDDTKTSGNGLVDIGAGLEGIDGLAAEVHSEGLMHVAVLATGSDGALFAATA